MADATDPVDRLLSGPLSGSGKVESDPVSSMLLSPLAGSTPLKAQEHIDKIARQNPTQPLSDEEYERDVKPFVQQNFPGADLDKAKESYGHQRKLEQARDAIKDQSEGTGHYLQSRSVPWAARVKQIRDARDYQEAVRQFQAGNQNPDVYNTIAGYERIQQIRKDQGTAGDAQDLLASAPSMLGEMAMGGKALGAIGKAVPSLGFLAPSAEAGAVNVASKLTLAGAAKGTAAFAARTGANLILNPNLYLDSAVQNSLEKGGNPLDAKNLAPAVAHGALTVAILGNLTKGVPGTAGSGVKDYLKTIAMRTGVGISEQALTDVAASGIDDAAKKVLGRSLGLDTKYGTIGTIMRGENDGLRQLTGQALMFSAFAALHGREADPVKKYVEQLNLLADRGYSREEAVPLAAEKLKAEAAEIPGLQVDKDQPPPAAETVQSLLHGLSPEDAEELQKYSKPAEPKPQAAEVPAKGKVRRLPPEHAQDLIDQINQEQPKGEPLTQPAKPGETLEEGLKSLWKGQPAESPAAVPENPATSQEGPASPAEARPANPTAEGEITPPATNAEAGRSFYHVADYKNPEKSVGKAIEMLDRKGSPLPYALHSWDGPNAEMNHEANLPPKGASLQFNRDAYQDNGKIEEAGTGTSFARSNKPVRYDPALEAVHYKGKATDAAYERLQNKVEEINKERADGELMRQYENDGPLPPVELKLERRAKPRPAGEAPKPELREPETTPPEMFRSETSAAKATRDRVAEMRAAQAGKAGAPKPAPMIDHRSADAMIQKEAEAAEVPHEPAGELRPITEATRKELADEVSRDKGNLTDLEREILNERLAHATSFRELGKLFGISHEQVRLLEKKALAKIGREGSVDEFHLEGPGGKIVENIAKGKDVAQQDLNTVDFEYQRNARINQIGDAVDQFNSLKKRIQKEQESGTIPAEREAKFIAELQRLRRVIDEGSDNARAPSERQAEGPAASEAGGEAPVRRGDLAGGDQGAAAGPNPAESPGGPASGETGGPAPQLPGADAGGQAAESGGGQAGGNELKQSPLLQKAVDFLVGPESEAGALNVSRIGEVAKEAYEKLKTGVRGFLDHTNKLAGAKFPKVSRMSEESGNAAAHFDSAPEFGRRAAVDYIDRVLGKDATPEQAQLWGTTFKEERSRFAADNLRKESAAYSYAASQARQQNDPKAAGKFAKKATEALQQALSIEKVTEVGKQGSILPAEADYQRVLGSQEYKDVMGRYEKELTPVLEQWFKQAEGMADTDTIASRTQIPGRPFTAKAVEEGPPEPERLGTSRGSLANRRLHKLQAARQAGLDAEHYETDLREIINHTIQSRVTLAAKAKLYRTLEAEGLATWTKPGERVGNSERLDDVHPPKNTQAAKNGETDFWITKEGQANDEIRQVLRVDRSASLPIIKQAADASTWGSLISTLEAAYHTKNNLTFLFKPGVSPIDFVKNMVGYAKSDPTTMKRLVDLAEIGAAQDGHAASRVQMERTLLPHPLSDKPTIWTARTWTGRFLEMVQSAMRVTGDQAFDRLVRQGRAEGSEQNRRDFINQLGNYSKGSQSRLVVLLRDLGVGPFATAGSNYIMQGVRSVLGTPGATATSWKQAVGLRAEQYARVLSVVGATALANYFRWGRLDGDDNTPLGHYKWGDLPSGKSATIDFTAFTGLPRGMRQMGLLALAEGYRKDTPAGKQLDQAATSAGLSALHPMFGPLPSFTYTAATGRDIMGSQLATRVSTARTPAGVMKARNLGKPEAGSSQMWENLKAALWHSVPLLGTLAGHGKPGDEDKSAGERSLELLGPFGTQERGFKAKKARR